MSARLIEPHPRGHTPRAGTVPFVAELLVRAPAARVFERHPSLFVMDPRGTLRRLDGDVAGSLEDLRAVVATDVLRYFEYELAWEMLQRASAPVSAAPAGTATATPPPTR